MKCKRVLMAVLSASVLSASVLLGSVLAAPLAAQAPSTEATLPPAHVDPSSAVVIGPAPHALSNWITYTRHNCCQGEIAPHFIGSELYFRVGPSFPLGGTVFGDVLDVGWMIGGGAKVQFFNDAGDRAWTVDASLFNVYNGAPANNVVVPIQLGPGAAPIATTLDSFNQTFVGIGMGREWYFARPRADNGMGWRVGVDGGYRWGTCRATFDVIQHRTDVTHGAYVAGFTDIEVPCGCCIWLGGLRAEWAYTYSDILQSSGGDLAFINLLFTAGLRY